MFNKFNIITIIFLFTITYSQTQEYVLKDGTKFTGTVISESDTDLVVQTNFGAVTIKIPLNYCR